MFPPLLCHGSDSTVEGYLDAFEYVADVVGEHRVGLGTDFATGQSDAALEYMDRDKGYGRWTVEFGDPRFPRGLETIGQLPTLTSAMQRRGWSAETIRGFLGENWLSYFGRVWTSKE